MTAADQAVFSWLLSAQIPLLCPQEYAWMGRMQVTAYPLFIYSPGDKLPTSSKPGHLPQRFFLFCKHGSCTAATFSVLTLRRDSLLKLSLSSFFTPMSQGGFSPYPHGVHFSGHGSAPPATSTVSVSDPCHVYVYLNRREALHSIRKAMGLGACLFILQWRAEIPGKELLWGQPSLYHWAFCGGVNLCLLQREVRDPPIGMYGHTLQCRMKYVPPPHPCAPPAPMWNPEQRWPGSLPPSTAGT